MSRISIHHALAVLTLLILKKGVSVNKYNFNEDELKHIQKNLFLYNTGISRSANSILHLHQKN